MTKNTTIALAIGIVLIVLGTIYYTSSKSVPTLDTAPVNTGVQNSLQETPLTTTPTIEGTVNVVELVVEGNNFSFSPTTLTVKKGATVKITFNNIEGFHDLVIDEFSVATPQINAGSATVEFVADKVGNFEYYCSVGNHRAMGMKGTLVVTE